MPDTNYQAKPEPLLPVSECVHVKTAPRLTVPHASERGCAVMTSNKRTSQRIYVLHKRQGNQIMFILKERRYHFSPAALLLLLLLLSQATTTSMLLQPQLLPFVANTHMSNARKPGNNLARLVCKKGERESGGYTSQ